MAQAESTDALRGRGGGGMRESVSRRSERDSSTAGNRSQDKQWLGSTRDRSGNRRIERLVRDILAAGKEADQRPSPASGRVAKRMGQSGISEFKRVNRMGERDWLLDRERDCAVAHDSGKEPETCGKLHLNLCGHGRCEQDSTLSRARVRPSDVCKISFSTCSRKSDERMQIESVQLLSAHYWSTGSRAKNSRLEPQHHGER